MRERQRQLHISAWCASDHTSIYPVPCVCVIVVFGVLCINVFVCPLLPCALQAALVADSPYYKLLIGRILGYAEPNIRHHILVGLGV